MNILQLIKQADALSPAIQNLLKESKNCKTDDNDEKMNKSLSDKVLKSKLSDTEYRVTQNKETEKPFTGKYLYEISDGVYKCLVCNHVLFDSSSKFSSGCGWPAFNKPVDDKSILASVDVSSGRLRVEVSCKHCKAHLGHVFDDGPVSTGLRYCINSCSLSFQSNKK